MATIELDDGAVNKSHDNNTTARQLFAVRLVHIRRISNRSHFSLSFFLRETNRIAVDILMNGPLRYVFRK
jgi:hypothetical protein